MMNRATRYSDDDDEGAQVDDVSDPGPMEGLSTLPKGADVTRGAQALLASPFRQIASPAAPAVGRRLAASRGQSGPAAVVPTRTASAPTAPGHHHHGGPVPTIPGPVALAAAAGGGGGGENNPLDANNNAITTPPLLLAGTIVRNRWEIIERLGAGAFGETYAAREINRSGGAAGSPPGVDSLAGSSSGYSPTNGAGAGPLEVCIKVEKPGKRSVLRTEMLALKRAQSCPHVVKYISSGQHDTYNYIVMQRMRESLSDFRRHYRGGVLDLYTAFFLGLSALTSIQELHDIGLVHRDIKPSNFVLGYGHDRNTLFLIDFGLARRYRLSNGQVKPPRLNAGFRGTTRYASLAAHQQKELGPVDDLWSFLFMLVELITGSLPWRKVKEKDAIARMKEVHAGPNLVRSLPRELTQFVSHLMGLKFEDAPDYEMLKGLLHQTIARKTLRPPDEQQSLLLGTTIQAAAVIAEMNPLVSAEQFLANHGSKGAANGGSNGVSNGVTSGNPANGGGAPNSAHVSPRDVKVGVQNGNGTAATAGPAAGNGIPKDATPPGAQRGNPGGGLASSRGGPPVQDGGGLEGVGSSGQRLPAATRSGPMYLPSTSVMEADNNAAGDRDRAGAAAGGGTGFLESVGDVGQDHFVSIVDVRRHATGGVNMIQLLLNSAISETTPSSNNDMAPRAGGAVFAAAFHGGADAFQGSHSALEGCDNPDAMIELRKATGSPINSNSHIPSGVLLGDGGGSGGLPRPDDAQPPRSPGQGVVIAFSPRESMELTTGVAGQQGPTSARAQSARGGGDRGSERRVPADVPEGDLDMPPKEEKTTCECGCVVS